VGTRWAGYHLLASAPPHSARVAVGTDTSAAVLELDLHLGGAAQVGDVFGFVADLFAPASGQGATDRNATISLDRIRSPPPARRSCDGT
jgi:hypothetical protein